MVQEKLQYLDIDFLKFSAVLAVNTINDKKYFYDPIRKKQVVVQPEEMVRQLILACFLQGKYYPASRIAVEKSLMVDGRLRRFDILVFDKKGAPWLLVECKAYTYEIDTRAVHQAASYNRILNAPYLMVSNGKKTICSLIEKDKERLLYLDQLPQLPIKE